MDALISFDGIADVANNLIDKISSAIGWTANRSTPQREARNTFIAEVQKLDISPLEKAAFISDANKIIREYKNQTSIVQNALLLLAPSAQPYDVSDDWILQFMDKARLVSDANFQVIWGAILAEECNSPGSIPKAVLHILSQMDGKHAESFALVCSLSVYIQTDNGLEYTPVIPYYEYENFFRRAGLKFEALIDLKAIGLIDVKVSSSLFSSFVMDELESRVVNYFDRRYTLPEALSYLSVGSVVFTRVGEALCKAIGQKEIDGFFEECCVPFWRGAEERWRKGE